MTSTEEYIQALYKHYYNCYPNTPETKKWEKKEIYMTECCLKSIYSNPTLEISSPNEKRLVWLLPAQWSLDNRLYVIIESIELEEHSPYVCMKVKFPLFLSIVHAVTGICSVKPGCIYIYGDTELECIIKISTLIEINTEKSEKKKKSGLSLSDKLIVEHNRSFLEMYKFTDVELVQKYTMMRNHLISSISYPSSTNTRPKEEKKRGFSTSSALSKHRTYAIIPNDNKMEAFLSNYK